MSKEAKLFIKENVKDINKLSELMQSYADQELNKALNEALIGKNRIKGIPSSNKIAEFVRNYITHKK